MTEQPFAQQQPQPPYRRLRRSQVDRKIGGVCGGVGEYFGVDPTLVRVAFLVLTVLTGGAFILAYLLAFLVMPDWMASPGEPMWQAQPQRPVE